MKRLVAVLAALSFVAGTVAAAPAAVAATGSPRLHWQPCHAELGPTFECATLRVPLDHDHPHGPKISLSVVRLPATDPDLRIGSLFLNPGGPGASGVELVLTLGPLMFTDQVRQRFDLVGFDPRGIVGSSPLLCFRSAEDAQSVVPPFAFPVDPAEQALQETLDKTFNRACQRRGGPIVNHMATADVARDLDLLRQAVGDRQLTYAGYSYGSYLGVTYANLFPGRVRAVMVDGVIDPISYATGRGGEAKTVPFLTRLRADAGAQATLNEFFRLCDQAGPERCSFAPDSAARFATTAERLRQEPVPFVDPETGEPILLTYADLIGFVLNALYSSASWPALAEVLNLVEQATNPADLTKALTAPGHRSLPPREPRYRNSVEGKLGVWCSDTVNPDDHSHWATAGADADKQFGYFGRPFTWTSSPCAVWDGRDQDRYLGPFNRTTANPVLVVGNRYDPATPYHGAVIVNRLLPNSRLLTVEGWGHTSLFLSQCADSTISRYLIDRSIPPIGATCAQDLQPFTPSRAQPGNPTAGSRQQARTEALSQIALDQERTR